MNATRNCKVTVVWCIDPHEFTRMKSLTNIDSKDLMIQTFVAKHYNAIKRY